MFLRELRFDLFLKKEFGICGLIAHFNKISYSQISDGVPIWFSQRFVVFEDPRPVISMFSNQLIQHYTVFKTAIHSLSVKWNYCMRGITNKRHLVVKGPRKTLDLDKRTHGIVQKIMDEGWHERYCVRKFFVKELLYLIFRFEFIKGFWPFERKE